MLKHSTRPFLNSRRKTSAITTLTAMWEQKETQRMKASIPESELIVCMWYGGLEDSRESTLAKWEQGGKSSFSPTSAAGVFLNLKL